MTTSKLHQNALRVDTAKDDCLLSLLTNDDLDAFSLWLQHNLADFCPNIDRTTYNHAANSETLAFTKLTEMSIHFSAESSYVVPYATDLLSAMYSLKSYDCFKALLTYRNIHILHKPIFNPLPLLEKTSFAYLLPTSKINALHNSHKSSFHANAFLSNLVTGSAEDILKWFSGCENIWDDLFFSRNDDRLKSILSFADDYYKRDSCLVAALGMAQIISPSEVSALCNTSRITFHPDTISQVERHLLSSSNHLTYQKNLFPPAL